jgi:hypothetical protein
VWRRGQHSAARAADAAGNRNDRRRNEHRAATRNDNCANRVDSAVCHAVRKRSPERDAWRCRKSAQRRRGQTEK